MAKHAVWLTAGVLAFAVGMPSPALADKPAPERSYKVVAPGGKYVFVMIAPRPVEVDLNPWNEETRAKIREIRRVYNRSGLYRTDGSTEPLWTVSWYAHSVEVASDGVHLIRHGPWASSTREEAFSFFANGKLLWAWQINELVDVPALLPHSVSHFQWRNEDQFDDAKLEYTVSTLDGNRFVFDVRSGNVVSQSRPIRVGLWGVGIIVGIAGFAWLVHKRRRVKRDRAQSTMSAVGRQL
jgi:hypothetical protein